MRTPEQMFAAYSKLGRTTQQMKTLARAVKREDFREYVEKVERLEREELFK